MERGLTPSLDLHQLLCSHSQHQKDGESSSPDTLDPERASCLRQTKQGQMKDGEVHGGQAGVGQREP